MLAYHLKATKLHCISMSRENTTAQPNALANPSRCYSFRGPSETSAVWLSSGCFALLEHCLRRICSQGDR